MQKLFYTNDNPTQAEVGLFLEGGYYRVKNKQYHNLQYAPIRRYTGRNETFPKKISVDMDDIDYDQSIIFDEKKQRVYLRGFISQSTLTYVLARTKELGWEILEEETLADTKQNTKKSLMDTLNEGREEVNEIDPSIKKLQERVQSASAKAMQSAGAKAMQPASSRTQSVVARAMKRLKPDDLDDMQMPDDNAPMDDRGVSHTTPADDMQIADADILQVTNAVDETKQQKVGRRATSRRKAVTPVEQQEDNVAVEESAPGYHEAEGYDAVADYLGGNPTIQGDNLPQDDVFPKQDYAPQQNTVPQQNVATGRRSRRRSASGGKITGQEDVNYSAEIIPDEQPASTRFTDTQPAKTKTQYANTDVDIPNAQPEMPEPTVVMPSEAHEPERQVQKPIDKGNTSAYTGRRKRQGKAGESVEDTIPQSIDATPQTADLIKEETEQQPSYVQAPAKAPTVSAASPTTPASPTSHRRRAGNTVANRDTVDKPVKQDLPEQQVGSTVTERVSTASKKENDLFTQGDEAFYFSGSASKPVSAKPASVKPATAQPASSIQGVTHQKDEYEPQPEDDGYMDDYSSDEDDWNASVLTEYLNR